MKCEQRTRLRVYSIKNNAPATYPKLGFNTITTCPESWEMSKGLGPDSDSQGPDSFIRVWIQKI